MHPKNGDIIGAAEVAEFAAVSMNSFPIVLVLLSLTAIAMAPLNAINPGLDKKSPAAELPQSKCRWNDCRRKPKGRREPGRAETSTVVF
jgi:hypothetical protein